MLREKCNCTDLHRVNVLQLAVNSADDDVNGNCGGGGEGEGRGRKLGKGEGRELEHELLFFTKLFLRSE